jgi:hypothetical protein
MRLHLEQRDGTIRRAATVMFTGRDASLYLIPYAECGEYFYGGRTMQPGQVEDSFDFRGQLGADTNPKLSLHESGCVHIYAKDEPRAGPVFIPPLTELRGEHVATVQWDTIRGAPVNRRRMRVTGSERDYAFGVPDDVEAGALLIYANGERNLFLTEYVQFAIQVERGAEPPVFFGVTGVARDKLGDDSGVSVVAGFDPRKTADEANAYLYLRGL